MVKNLDKSYWGESENFDFGRDSIFLEGGVGQKVLEKNEVSKQYTI